MAGGDSYKKFSNLEGFFFQMIFFIKSYVRSVSDYLVELIIYFSYKTWLTAFLLFVYKRFVCYFCHAFCSLFNEPQ